MKNKLYTVLTGLVLVSLAFPSYAQASDGEEYITISVDAADDNADLRYALDSDDMSAFTESNEFTVPAGTSHTIYVKDVAGNITSQRYEPQNAGEEDYGAGYDEEEQRINIDLELGRKDETDETGNPGTASVLSRTDTDGTVDGEKVFFTFSTKEGEELYLVVDQGRGTDNVYLLDTVSLADLRVLADGSDATDSTGDKKEDNLLSILASEEEAKNISTEQVEEKPKSKFGNNLVILLFAMAGGGVYYYIKIYRNKKDEAMDVIDAMDMDEFAPEEDEEEELDFDYNDAEKKKYLESLINGELGEDTFFDQDPDEYAATGEEDDEEQEANDFYDGMEADF